LITFEVSCNTVLHNGTIIYSVINIRLHSSRTIPWAVEFATVAAGNSFHLVQPNIYL